MRLGVLASGKGTTLQAVLDACNAGTLPVTVGVVVSNNGGSGALERAHSAGIPALHLSSRTHPGPGELDLAMQRALAEHRVELVLLAGYMKKLGPATLSAFSGRILNTHPALLPKFGGQGMFGMRVHEAVLASGEAVTGVTIHWVEAEYDTGPVIAQAEVPVLPEDTAERLAERVQTRERSLLIEVLADLATKSRQAP